MAEPYEQWVWLVEEEDGREGAIAAGISDMVVVLAFRSKTLADQVEPIARAHGQASGRPVRLAHLREIT